MNHFSGRDASLRTIGTSEINQVELLCSEWKIKIKGPSIADILTRWRRHLNRSEGNYCEVGERMQVFGQKLDLFSRLAVPFIYAT